MSALASSLVPSLGWALVHFIWQGLAVGMAAALALMLLRNARPQLRYAVACAALALCVALPVIGIVRGLHADETAVVPTASVVVSAVDSAVDLPIASLSSWRSALQSRLPWIVALWSLGAALLALRMALGLAWVDRVRRSCAGAVDPAWQARLDGLAVKFGLRQEIALRVVSDLDSPVAAGWWRPVVLVPAALIARMPPELLEALLAHELAHIKRHDYLINLVQSAIEALLFYHPIVWWLSRRIRIERERIADDLAAQAIAEPRRMALALQRLDLLLSSQENFPVPQLAPAANGDNLMSRIQHLIRPGQHRLSWKVAFPILGLSAICLTVFAQGNKPAPAAAKLAVEAPVTVSDISVARPSRGDAYALVRDGHDSMTVSGTTSDIRAADRAKLSLKGDFLWFRRGDKAYVVQDPAILAKANEAWKPTEAVGAKMEALGGKMEAHGKVMEGLSKEMEALGVRGEPGRAEMEKTGARMQEASQQQQAVSMKMQKLSLQMQRASDDAEREALDRKMEALQAEMEPLQAQMEKLGDSMNEYSRRMQAAHQPMQDLSHEMEQASKPMHALSQQMDVLGKQQEKLSREADRVVRALIDDALRTGRAVPTSKFN